MRDTPPHPSRTYWSEPKKKENETALREQTRFETSDPGLRIQTAGNNLDVGRILRAR
jgi:hypothetical protein